LRVFEAKGAAMTLGDFNFEVSRLGEGRIPSPLKGVSFVEKDERVLFHSGLSEGKDYVEDGKTLPSFEKAGRREKIYFGPINNEEPEG
jgi:6-phosphofructokinase 1